MKYATTTRTALALLVVKLAAFIFVSRLNFASPDSLRHTVLWRDSRAAAALRKWGEGNLIFGLSWPCGGHITSQLCLSTNFNHITLQIRSCIVWSFEGSSSFFVVCEWSGALRFGIEDRCLQVFPFRLWLSELSV